MDVFRVEVRKLADFLHIDGRAVTEFEFHVHRCLRLVSRGAEVRVADLRNGGSDEHLLPEIRFRKFNVQFLVDLVQCHESVITLRCHAALVLDEGFLI